MAGLALITSKSLNAREVLTHSCSTVPCEGWEWTLKTRGKQKYLGPPGNYREGGGGWHKALMVGSVSLWRRLLASHP